MTIAGSGSPASRPSRWDNAWFAGLCALCLVPVWAHEHFASTDGPSHVYNATALARYFGDQCTIYREYLALNPFPVPNWIGHLLMAAFATVATPALAEKCFLSAYVVGLPLALRYAVAGVNPGNRTVALLIFPYVHGMVLLGGWYNFSASLVVLLFALGYWLRWTRGLARPSALVWTLLFALLYFSHPVTLVASLLAIGVLAIASALVEESDGAGGSFDRARLVASARRTFASLRIPLLCAAPFAAMILVFALWNPPLESRGSAIPGSTPLNIYLLNELMGPLAPGELLLAAAYGVFLWVAFATTVLPLRRLRSDPTRLGLLAVSGVFVILSVVFPDRMSGGGNLMRRFALVALFSMLVWLGAHDFGRGYRWLMRLTVLVVLSAQLGMRAPVFAEVEEYHQGLREVGAAVGPDEPITALVLHDAAFPRPYYTPILMRNSSAYLAADRCLVDMTNYEAQVKSFPLGLRPQIPRVPRQPLVALQPGRPRTQWLLLSEVPAQQSEEERAQAERARAMVSTTHELVTSSERGGVHQLYRVREGEAR